MKRRLGPPWMQMAADVIRYGVATRSGLMLLLVVVGVLAVAFGAAVQVAVPWAIYPFV